MKNSEIVLAVIAAAGWLWGIIQFFISRKNQKKDKAIEKRFDVYSDFMNKIDELNSNIRTDPSFIVGITDDIFAKIATGSPTESDLALIEFNATLMVYVKNAAKSMSIINSEFNKIQLVCSERLLPLINEYKKLCIDFNNEVQSTLSSLSRNNDINKTVAALQRFNHLERYSRFTELDQEVKKMMREEIGFYNK